MVLVSGREKEDLRMAKWLPLYPFYQFFMRLITAFSMINELFRKKSRRVEYGSLVGIGKRQKVLAMKVKFHLDKKQAQSDDGVKVAYGQAKRGAIAFSWYLILSLVISPLLFVAYFFEDKLS
ncbi:hypothetical protein OK016_19530 [Vibrio chagasii]|nr:hypothetical protein [Vibrio chagasii]